MPTMIKGKVIGGNQINWHSKLVAYTSTVKHTTSPVATGNTTTICTMVSVGVAGSGMVSSGSFGSEWSSGPIQKSTIIRWLATEVESHPSLDQISFSYCNVISVDRENVAMCAITERVGRDTGNHDTVASEAWLRLWQQLCRWMHKANRAVSCLAW